MRKIFYTFMLLILFTGCESKEVAIQADSPFVMESSCSDNYAEEYNDLFLSLYYEEEYTLSLYEPPDGAYLGAYVLESEGASYNMMAFDEMTEKSHSSYIYSMRVSDDVPYTWILTCIKEGKIPHIVIHPDNDYVMYDLEKIKVLSEKLGNIYVPMFVELYPNPKAEAVTPPKYIDFFKEARIYFNENAPNVAIIYTGDVRNKNSFLYYPGDGYVDWIGITMSYPYYDGDMASNRDITSEFERIYYTYHKSKPIMITGFMVSHFSTLDYSYRSDFACRGIDIVYNELLNKYPRLKGICYIDYDATKANSKIKGAENFSLLDDYTVLSSYKKLVSKDTFLTDISEELGVIFEMFRSPYNCLSRDGAIYISEKSIRKDFLKNIDSNFIKGRILVDGEYYYSSQAFYEITGFGVYYYKSSNMVIAKRD